MSDGVVVMGDGVMVMSDRCDGGEWCGGDE